METATAVVVVGEYSGIYGAYHGNTKDEALKHGLLYLDTFLDPEHSFLNNHPYEYPRD